MGIFAPQNPGIGGIDELTSAEEAFIQNLAGLTYAQGDILYHDGNDLVNLGPGNSGEFLKTQGAAANPIWAAVAGAGDFSGPASATDDAIVTFDGTGGKTGQNTVVTIAQTTGNTAGMGTLGVGAITTTAALDMGSNLINNVTDPASSQDAATKAYVDQSVSFISTYYHNNTASDIGGIYYKMLEASTGEAESSFTIAGLGSGAGQALTNFATDANLPGVNILKTGTYTGHIHAERTAGTRSALVYFEIYTRTSGGTETLRTTSEDSATITSKADVTIHATIASDVVINTTDRIIIKWLADIGASGSDATVVLYVEGDDASRLEVPTTTEVLNSVFVRQDGTKALTANWDAGSFTITGTQFISDIGGGTAPFVVTSTTEVANLKAATATLATTATNVTVSDNESTAEENVITFVAGAAGSGDVGLEADGDFTYNPNTGTLSATIFSGAGTSLTGTASSLTAGNVTTNANLTGIVTSTGNATAIAAKAIAISKLADGTDGELITWDAAGVIDTVAVGTANHVLTSNGVGVAPTFQAAAGGGANVTLSNLTAGSVAINTTLASDTDNTDDLGTAPIGWANLWLGNTSVITWSTAPSTADVTLTHSANTLTFAGGDVVGLGNTTATSYGGITEANLVDKSASETISGQWAFGRYTTFTFGDDTPTVGPFVQFKRSRDASADVQDGDDIGELRFWGKGNGTDQRGAAIIARVDGTPGGATDMPSELLFQTSPEASATPVTRLTIGSDGVATFTETIVGSITGNAATATVATTVTITDNESTNENNPIVFVENGEGAGGDLGLESDGTLFYNPSTGFITCGGLVGALTGNASTVTGFTPAGGSLTLAGADAVTITTTGTTNSTLPVGTKTLVATDVATLSSLTSTGALVSGSIASGFGTINIGTSNAVSCGTVELGHASDTTLTRSAGGVLAVEGVVLPSISSTNTLTNKRVTSRVTTEASAAEPTINTDNSDAHSITALATNVTNMTTNLSGTPTNFQKLIIRFLDNGTGRTIAWSTGFEDNGAALPATTTANKLLTVGFIYDTASSKWGCVAVADET